jgi:hypothetical protein
VKKKLKYSEKYNNGTYIEKDEVLRILSHQTNQPELLEATRYTDDSESYTVRITLTAEEIQKMNQKL